MKMYTIYTDSHLSLYRDRFLPTLPKDVELVPKKVQQYSKTCKFQEPGWKETMMEKVNLILQAIEDNWGEVFIYSDCDIQFFDEYIVEDLLKELGDKDIAFQWDYIQYCAGFYIARANDIVKNLFLEVKELYDQFKGDQDALNWIIAKRKYAAKRLSDRYWNFGLTNVDRLWRNDDVFRVPDNMVLHHANWTRGVADKFALMDVVKQKHYRPKRNIISFSLYGNLPRYNIGALRNVELAKTIYPGWVCKFYISSDTDIELIKELSAHENVEIELMEPDGHNGRLWRFLAAADIDAHSVIFRDTDSRLSIREKLAVDEWLQSSKILHVMRDLPPHVGMMGGMWGVKGGAIMDMQKLISILGRVDNAVWGDDENFLNNVIFKNYSYSVHVNDYRLENNNFPTQREGLAYIGEQYDEYDRLLNPQYRELLMSTKIQ